MPPANPDPAPSGPPPPPRLDEEQDRLLQALIGRGLILPEDLVGCKPPDGPGAKPLLTRFVEAGVLTKNQARRAFQKLSLLLGEEIPGYEILDKLGQGAMGEVYKARQLSMNRLVAVKKLHPRLAAKPHILDRLVREAHLAARLSHNNIVQAIDVGSAGKTHYFVMEYVAGTTIKDELEDGKVYEEREAVEITLQIAQALQHAHRRGLIHRDVKPGNIILTLDGIAKLADLGMARDTSNRAIAQEEKGMAMGTPYYMAPEQVRGEEDIDVRADIYSLGATLYHMVTGQPPFPVKGVEAVFRAHLEQELTPPDHLNTKLSAGLGEVVEVMLAKRREQRYRNPDDLIFDLECLLNGEAPKFAHKRALASKLEDLAQGEDEEDPEEGHKGIPWLWVAPLAAALAVSLIANLLFLLRG